MSRICDVTGRKPMFGNNVSHAHNKSRRRFDINLQKKRFWLADENRWITLNVSTQGLRLIDKIGIRKVINKMKAEGKKVQLINIKSTILYFKGVFLVRKTPFFISHYWVKINSYSNHIIRAVAE